MIVFKTDWSFRVLSITSRIIIIGGFATCSCSINDLNEMLGRLISSKRYDLGFWDGIFNERFVFQKVYFLNLNSWNFIAIVDQAIFRIFESKMFEVFVWSNFNIMFPILDGTLEPLTWNFEEILFSFLWIIQILFFIIIKFFIT